MGAYEVHINGLSIFRIWLNVLRFETFIPFAIYLLLFFFFLSFISYRYLRSLSSQPYLHSKYVDCGRYIKASISRRTRPILADNLCPDSTHISYIYMYREHRRHFYANTLVHTRASSNRVNIPHELRRIIHREKKRPKEIPFYRRKRLSRKCSPQ